MSGVWPFAAVAPVSAVRAIGARKNNAELMVDCHRLGYIRDTDRVLDVTYGKGRFWKKYRPEGLITNDLDWSTDAFWHFDFRRLPFDSMDVVVFDPPYKLNGTGGSHPSDEGYGVAGGYVDWRDKHQLIIDGIEECARIAGRMLLVKCQDQVCSGAVRWQTYTFTATAARCGFELVDMLHVQGHRKQPPGRRQVHAARDYSTLLVLGREGS